jgi:hypothetical protein
MPNIFNTLSLQSNPFHSDEQPTRGCIFRSTNTVGNWGKTEECCEII